MLVDSTLQSNWLGILLKIFRFEIQPKSGCRLHHLHFGCGSFELACAERFIGENASNGI